MLGLYIHVPFCAKVCDYCDFNVFQAPPKLYAEFVDLLVLELRFLRERYAERWHEIGTLYVGGGTPSALSAELLRTIFRELERLGAFLDLREATLEMNPESCEAEKVNLAKSFGFDRFSLGIQSFDEEILKAVGRGHSVLAARRALELLLSARVRVNADLMFMLPGQSVESFVRDVRELAKSGVGHVSFYGLTVAEGTRLGYRLRKGEVQVDEDAYEPMYEAGVREVLAAGFERYEVSNFAKRGEESLHNKHYWERGEYLGAGPGAHSFIGNLRFSAPEKYSRWKAWVLNGFDEGAYERDVLNDSAKISEMIWLSLRQERGLDLVRLERDFGYKIQDEKLDRWLRRGFLARSGNSVKLVGRGWVMMDSVVEDFMP